MLIRFILWICCLLVIGNSVLAQKSTPDAVGIQPDSSYGGVLNTIRNITITGNKRTKIYIIERELAFEKGKTYLSKDLNRKITLTKEQLINTTLFVDVSITQLQVDNSMIDITIDVKERWYIFPLPYFKVVDRNWNEWINVHGASLSRVNYGVKVSENNLTGRNDKLNIWLIGGYTQQISFNYTQPYMDPKLRYGMFFGFQYARSREVNYATDSDTLKFLKLPNFASTYANAHVGFSYRKGSKERHSIRLSYNDMKVDSAIIKVNQDFLGSGQLKEKYFDLTYAFQYFNVDYIRYPLRGWYVDINATKRFSKSLNMFSITGKYLQTWELFSNSYFMVQLAGSVKFPFNQPYYNAHLLGYGDLSMRGMENLVVDGTLGGCIKGTFRKKLFGFTIKNYLKKKTHDRIPFTFYGKIYSDWGYVYNKNNNNNSRLTNKILRTGGIGIDIVTIYDIIFKLEFSFNQLGDRGVYYHTGSDF